MRPALTASLVALALVVPHATSAVCNAAGSYQNSNGQTVPTPRCRDQNTGASYVCRDGSFSFSAHRRGACSNHGGVARSLTTDH